MKQQKVLFTSHTANFSKFNRPFMRDLRDRGHIVHYASVGEEPVLDTDQNFTVPFARSPFKLLQNLRAYRALKKLLEREDYDLIHCNTPTGGAITRLAAKHARLEKRPAIIYTAHGLHFYRGAPGINWLLYYPIEKWLARTTDAIVTINDEDYQLAKHKFPAKNIYKIPGVGVDLSKFHPAKSGKSALRRRHHFADKDFILIYAAELNRNKDQAFLITNLAKLTQTIPNVRLLLIGAGPLEAKLKAQVAAAGLERHVKFLGYRHDVDELYRLADVAVSASHREGLGLNLVEGMASGLPVVARDNRGHREIVTSRKEGFLFRDGAEFRAAIEKLYCDPALRQKIAQHNPQAATKFSLEKSRRLMQKIYRATLLGTTMSQDDPDRTQ